MAEEYVDIVSTTRVDIKVLRADKQELRETRGRIKLIANSKDYPEEVNGLIDAENEERKFVKAELNAQIDELTSRIDELVIIKNG